MDIEQMTNDSLILASASPRRAQLLREAGFSFTIQTSPVAEPTRKPAAIPTELWPMALAFIKAHAAQQKLRHKDALVIGADTIVVLAGRILNKPANRAHARRMLLCLSGKTHLVITGLALLRGDHHRLTRAVSVCRVRKLSPRWLETYLDSNLWQGKAGAYGIQDYNAPWVTLLTGERSNVIGLPMDLLKSELQSMMPVQRS